MLLRKTHSFLLKIVCKKLTANCSDERFPACHACLAVAMVTPSLYADDCKSSRIIDSAENLQLFQQDLENLEGLNTLNGMEFNDKKCKIIKITRKKQPITSTFFLNNTALEEVDEFRDLGPVSRKSR